MDKRFITIGIVVLIVIGVVWYGASRSFRKEQPALQAPLTAPQTQAMIVMLDPQNKSGEMGTATFTAANGKTQIVLKLSGAPKDVTQPAHIHTGTCANLGGVTYPLTFPVNGESVTVLNISLEQLLSELPLAINVHKSPQEAKVYYACGDIAK